MSKKDELIKQCRYYHGEKTNPYQKPPIEDEKLSWFWDMERVYVMHDGKIEGESEYYKTIKGKTYPGIPFDLLIAMFTSWAKHSYDTANELNGFYHLVDDYLSISNDHFPEDRVPEGMPDELF